MYGALLYILFFSCFASVAIQRDLYDSIIKKIKKNKKMPVLSFSFSHLHIVSGYQVSFFFSALVNNNSNNTICTWDVMSEVGGDLRDSRVQ